MCDFLSPSAQHEDASSSGSSSRLELAYLEDERLRALARIDELKSRLTELEQQLQESKQEVGGGAPTRQTHRARRRLLGIKAQLVFLLQADMERALLQGERQAEVDQLESETDVIAQLQRRLDELESAIQREKDKVGLDSGARSLTHTHTHTRAEPSSRLVDHMTCPSDVIGAPLLHVPPLSAALTTSVNL